MSDTYLELSVWRRMDGFAIRYRCLQCLDTQKYGVQSSDYYYARDKGAQTWASDAQFVELFLDTSPAERCTWFDSLSEAIEAHDATFDR